MSCANCTFSLETCQESTPFELRISVVIRAFLLLTPQKGPHVHISSLRQRYGLSIDASLSNLIRRFHRGSYYMLHLSSPFVNSFFQKRSQGQDETLPLDICRYEAPDFARMSLYVVLVQPGYIPHPRHRKGTTTHLFTLIADRMNTDNYILRNPFSGHVSRISIRRLHPQNQELSGNDSRCQAISVGAP